jgi:hypothetical protein
MMAMTTSNSMSVKARCKRCNNLRKIWLRGMDRTPKKNRLG